MASASIPPVSAQRSPLSLDAFPSETHLGLRVNVTASVDPLAQVLANTPGSVSFIIPVYNEIENIEPLVQEVQKAGMALQRPYEIVVVDDGSSDGTVEQLRQWTQKVPELRVVAFTRNYGQTAAMSAGFQYAHGDILVTLDGDLQNDPADVGRLIEVLENEHYDIVTGWRQNRQDNAMSRKLPSWIANRLIAATTGVHVHDYGCSLKAYRAEVAKAVPLYGEMHRFIPALASIDGARIKEVPVHHRARTHGSSKYNISRTFKVVLDLMTVLFFKHFITRPLHMFGRVGMVLLLGGFVINIYLLYEKLALGHSIGTRPLLTLGALLLLAGFQLICTGLIAELQSRTYFESQKKATYKIREIIKN
jgi:glycosyltransferase involved in cell wall biosynthesis